jgi:hypothetical protein
LTSISREQLDRVKQWLDDQFDRYRFMETSQCNLPLELLLSVGRFEPAQLDAYRLLFQRPLLVRLLPVTIRIMFSALIAGRMFSTWKDGNGRAIVG